MTRTRSTFHRGAVLAACTMMFMMAGATRAHAADQGGAASAVRPAASSACETARQQAWFARQLRMTEGDNEPLQPKEPAECGAPMRGADAGGGYAVAPAASNDGRYMKDGR